MVDIFSCNCHTGAVSSAIVANHMGKFGYTVAIGIELTFLMMLSGLPHDHASSAKASMISP